MSNGEKKPGKSGAAKPPVIDVEAKKVGGGESSAQVRAETGDGQKGASTGKGASAAGKKPEKADTRKVSGSGPKAAEKKATGKETKETKGGSAAAGVKKDTSKKDGKKDDGKPAVSAPVEKKAKARGGSWFWKGLFGILLLGGAAGGGAWLYQQYGPEKRLAAMQAQITMLERKLAGGGDLAALKEQLNTLQAEQGRLAAALKELSKSDGGELPLKVKALEEKVAALDALKGQVEGNTKAMQALQQALEGVRGQLATLKEGIEQLAQAPAPARGEGENAQGAAAPGAASAALVALKLSLQETQQRLAALARQLDDVRKEADPARMALLENRLKKQEEALVRVQDELRGAIEKVREQAAVAAKRAKEAQAVAAELKANPPVPEFTPPPEAAAYAVLREKVVSGAPFRAELEKLAALMPGEKALDALAPFAEKGVPTEAALAKGLDAAIAALKTSAEETQPAQEQDDPLAILKQKLSKVVKVRRAGEVDWPAVAKAAKEKLRQGGLAAAVAELSAHKGAMPEPLAGWLAQARARLATDKALDALADAVLRRAGKGAQ